mgnify:CR=1 FL=1
MIDAFSWLSIFNFFSIQLPYCYLENEQTQNAYIIIEILQPNKNKQFSKEKKQQQSDQILYKQISNKLKKWKKFF